MGNIAVNDEGRSDIRIEDHLVMLDGETSVMNRAIVIHEGRILNKMKNILTCLL